MNPPGARKNKLAVKFKVRD